MGKKKDEVVVVKKEKKQPTFKGNVLKVSKRIKLMAAYASLSGFPKRQFVRMFGEAEDNYKKNGRLVFGA